jgi:ABC-type transport system involved in multi-copper enzyme maturation permease subunit
MRISDQIVLIARAVFIELVRKRAMHVVMLIAALFVAGATIARAVGIENPATGTFLLNLGLSLAYWCAHILTLLLAAGQFPDEIENRTLYPLLAKPVSRGTVLFGKWLACAAAGCGIFISLGFVSWIAAPKMESYDAVLAVQTFLLIPFSIALLAALAILFSFVWTKGVSLVILGILFFAGDHIARLLGRWPAAYIPDFSKLDLITRCTDGIGPVSFRQFVGLILYAVILAASSLALASRLFERRPL